MEISIHFNFSRFMASLNALKLVGERQNQSAVVAFFIGKIS